MISFLAQRLPHPLIASVISYLPPEESSIWTKQNGEITKTVRQLLSNEYLRAIRFTEDHATAAYALHACSQASENTRNKQAFKLLSPQTMASVCIELSLWSVCLDPALQWDVVAKYLIDLSPCQAALVLVRICVHPEIENIQDIFRTLNSFMTRSELAGILKHFDDDTVLMVLINSFLHSRFGNVSVEEIYGLFTPETISRIIRRINTYNPDLALGVIDWMSDEYKIELALCF